MHDEAYFMNIMNKPKQFAFIFLNLDYI